MAINSYLEYRNSNEFKSCFRDLNQEKSHRYNAGFFGGTSNVVESGKPSTLNELHTELANASRKGPAADFAKTR